MAKKSTLKGHSPAAAARRKIQEALLAQPELTHVDIGGEERPFLLCVRGSRIAAGLGREPVQSLMRLVSRVAVVVASGGIGDVDDDADVGELVKGLLRSEAGAELLRSIGSADTLAELAECVWWGLLPFDEALDPELVEVWLTPAGIAEVFRSVLPAMFAFAGDVQAEGPVAEAPPGDPDPKAVAG